MPAGRSLDLATRSWRDPGPEPGPGQVLVRVHAVALQLPRHPGLPGAYQEKPAAAVHARVGDRAARSCGGRGRGRAGRRPGARARRRWATAATPSWPLLDADGDAALARRHERGQAAGHVRDLPDRVLRAAPPGAAPGGGDAAGARRRPAASGSAAIQLGKAAGARVIGDRRRRREVRGLRGSSAPTTSIDYTAEDFVARVKELTDGRGADVIYDPVGGDVFDASRRCVAFEGRILVIGFVGGRFAEAPANHVLIKNYAVVGVHWGFYRRMDARADPRVAGRAERPLGRGRDRPAGGRRAAAARRPPRRCAGSGRAAPPGRSCWCPEGRGRLHRQPWQQLRRCAGGAAPPSARLRGRAGPGRAPSLRTPPGSPAGPPRSSGMTSPGSLTGRYSHSPSLGVPLDWPPSIGRSGRCAPPAHLRNGCQAVWPPPGERRVDSAHHRRDPGPSARAHGRVGLLADVVERRPDLRGQRDRLGRHRRGELRGVAGADDGRRDAGPVAHPRQRHRQRGRAEPVGGGEHGLRRSAPSARRGAPRRTGRERGEAPRESAGVPSAYLPVSTPRPSGAQASSPTPWCAAAGSSATSACRARAASTPTCADTGTAMRPSARARSATVASCQPGGADEPHVAHPAGRHGRLRRRTASPPAARPASKPGSCHRSRWSVPSRRSGGVQPGEQRAAGRRRRRAGRREQPRARRARGRSRGTVWRQQLAEHVLRGAVAVAVRGLDERAARVDERA